MQRLLVFLVAITMAVALSLDEQYSPQWMRADPRLKRHLSPSYDVEQDLGNFRNLLDIGKRQVSVADDVGRHYDVYNRLFAAGKKRSIVSPAADIQATWAMSDFLERAGRK